MKFLLDHDVPENLSYLLRQLGHEVTLLREAPPEDADDEAVLRFAHESGCCRFMSRCGNASACTITWRD